MCPNLCIRLPGILFTERRTHTQTNCNENITPPSFRGGVKKKRRKKKKKKKKKKERKEKKKI